MNNNLEDKLKSILTIISDYDSDSDSIEEDWSEDDIRFFQPLVWACRQISAIIEDIQLKGRE